MSGMLVDRHGRCSPALFPKQIEGLNACQPSKRNRILYSGPRLSGKTNGALHCIADNAWQTSYANWCMLSVTQSVGIDSGVWTAMSRIILPDWISGNFGMRWMNGRNGEPKGTPHIENVTKKPTCMFTNRHSFKDDKWTGDYSQISLESLKNEDEVEERFKGKEYTGIFVNELSKFTNRRTFDTLILALRSMRGHLKKDQFIFLADTNPAEEGTESWIYKLWYELRLMDDDKLWSEFPDDDTERKADARHPLVPIRDSLQLIEFSVDDNLSMTDEDKLNLKSSLSHDPDLLARYYYGKWVTASADAIFRGVFRPLIHVVPDAKQLILPDPDVLWPQPGCFELILSIDPGATNFASFIMEKYTEQRLVKRLATDNEGNFIMDNGRHREISEMRDVICFKVLDELVIVGEDFHLADYVEELTRMMVMWEWAIGKPGQTMWRMWSDRMVFDVKIPFTDNFWHQSIHAASGGKIVLMAAERGRGSVAAGIDLLRKLLFERRILFSGTRCPHVINMLKSIKKGKTAASPVSAGSIWKHSLDGLRYGLVSELYDDMFTEVRGIMRKESGSSLVSVRT
jgi:hypothetical protein